MNIIASIWICSEATIVDLEDNAYKNTMIRIPNQFALPLEN